jgi:hypothetical protein
LDAIVSYRFNGFDEISINSSLEEQTIGQDFIVSFSAFPVFMGCVETPPEDDIFSQMHWKIEGDAIVVRPILDSSLVYLDNHNEVVGETWEAHHREFADFVLENRIGNSIYEVGGAHGLLSILTNAKEDVEWCIHDINPKPLNEYRGKIIQGKFVANCEIGNAYSTIVHSHTLEHVNDPYSFMQEISLSQKSGDVQILSVPNMDVMVKRADLNFLNFEHNYFLTRSRVYEILGEMGYRILKEKEFRTHSIFIAAVLDSKGRKTIEINRSHHLSVERELIVDYLEQCQNKVKKLNQAMSNFDGEIYIFGSHIFTQFLIAFGLNTQRLSSCLDNSIIKRGKRLYGTTLISFTPEEKLDRGKKQLVVGSIAGYEAEVRRQLLSLNPNVKIEFY